MDQSEVSATQPPSTSSESVVKAADDTLVSSKQRLQEQIDPVYRKKVRKLRQMKFKNDSDLLMRFPYPNELEQEDGIFMWNGLVILTQD